jgi:hypothetical protein
MKKIYLSFFLSCILYISSFAQTLIPPADELVLPQYAYFGGTAASRAPLATRLTLRGLTPSTTYRYIVGLSSTDNITTAFAPGSFWRVNNGSPGASGNITGYTTQKFALNGNELSGDQIQFGPTNYHARFTTDASGNYTGWFLLAPVGNSTQQAINSNAYFYIHLCLNSAPVSNPTISYRTTNTIQLLDYTNDNTGLSPLVGTTSNIGDEKFVLLYNNVNGTGRPLSTTYTENEGINITGFTTWYTGNVEGTSGKWGAVVPNNTAVRAIRFFNASDGSEIVVGNGTGNSSSDGIWNGVSTIINTGSTSTPITINSIAPTTLPITLSNFAGSANLNGVKLNWTTASETNNQYFEILRAGEDKNFISIGKVNGSGNSSTSKSYSFDDFNPATGNNYYQLKQVDFDGKSASFAPIAVSFGLTSNKISLLSSSDLAVTISISSATDKEAVISYVGLDGKIIYQQKTYLKAGLNSITLPVNKSAGNIGIISVSANKEQQSIKISR